MTITKGPEPIASVICLSDGVSASFSRWMKSGFSGVPRTSSTGPKGLSSRISNVSGPVATTSLANRSRVLPTGTRSPQRLSEATASFAWTGLPSLNWRPSRSLNRQTSPSAVFEYVSTICGLYSSFAFGANSTS